jgi:hypothetical protein
MSNQPTASFATLVDWIEGRLSDAESQLVADEVARADQETLGTIAWLRALKSISRTIRLESAPSELGRTLALRFAAHARAARPGVLQRVVAALTFDSARQFAASGARGAQTPGAPRQLVFTTDALDVAISIALRGDNQRYDLFGQILPKGDLAGDFSLQLLRGDDILQRISADELGEFTIPLVPAGIYELSLSTADVAIILAPLEVQAA